VAKRKRASYGALGLVRRPAYLVSACALAILVAWPLFIHEEFYVHVATLILLYSIGAASLHLILRTGHLSLGHAAFMGIGAYTSVLAMMRLNLPYPLAVLSAALVSGLIALAIGPVILRLRGVYFVLVTFMFGEVVRLLFVNWTGLTGGSNGIYQIPAPHPILTANSGFYYYYLALAAAFLSVGIIGRILRSEIGRAIDSIGDGERLAESSGVPVLRFKVMAFVIGSVLVAVQGSLGAHFIRYISPLSYTFTESLNFVVINVVGGMHSLVGTLIGTAFVISLPEFLRQWVEYQRVLYGVILIVVLLFLPTGLVGLGGRIRAFLKGQTPGRGVS
jgi:branched-chain amino acid transport system permease protein